MAFALGLATAFLGMTYPLNNVKKELEKTE